MQSKTESTESTKVKILTSARMEFSKYGLAGARVDRIAREAEVNKAMIYYHFRSKENLYQEVINWHVVQIGDFLEKNIAEELEPEERLLALSALYIRMFADNPNFAPIFLRELAEGGERIRNSFRQIILEKGLTVKLMEVIEKGKLNGQLREVDSRHAIVSFIGMNLFYLLAAPIINSIWEIRDEKEFCAQRPKAVADVFLNGIRRR
jgi:AcrR family transcriptional regulator